MINDVVLQITATIISSLILAGIFYLIHLVRKLIDRVELHDRVMFGEDGVDSWKGIIALLAETSKCAKENRRAVVELIEYLYDHNFIESTSPIMKLIYPALKEHS